MTITAGAHSSQPRRRSARAPSLSLGLCGRRSAGAAAGLRRVAGRRSGAVGGGHGTSPFDWSASLSWPVIFCSVLRRVDARRAGRPAWEMTMDMFWYAGVSGRTAAFASDVRMSLRNG